MFSRYRRPQNAGRAVNSVAAVVDRRDDVFLENVLEFVNRWSSVQLCFTKYG